MKRFGLIGRRLAHSYSPEIHRLFSDYEYKLYPLEPEELPAFLETTDLDGFNVTIPYKKEVLSACRTLTPIAREIGSVNTMVRLPGGGFLGDNTDVYGFACLLGKDAEALAGKKALVLGSGGASKSVCAVLKEKKIPFVVISRSGEDNYQNLSRHGDAALIVNTTPVGMYPNNGQSPLNLALFPNCRLVIDVIYNPAHTALMLQADALHIKNRNGMLMLTAQALRAGELFMDKVLPEELAEELADIISLRTKNIALIGMPGSGKTTVGEHLCRLTGRKMADTDKLVEEKAGMGIPEIFSRYGEGHFRKLETEALGEVSKESGLVIATGGGVVTIPENLPLLRQNSLCVYLERDPELLAREGRPISMSRDIKELARERKPLYRAFQERTYQNEDCTATAQQIKEDLNL